jgi:cysteine desulfurase/selenocysteine lyase
MNTPALLNDPKSALGRSQPLSIQPNPRRAEATPSPLFDVEAVRADFPALHQETRPGVRLAYLDSAATALKPRAVIESMCGYCTAYPGNVHRGLHALSERATAAFEGARETIARFLGAPSSSQVVFTRGTTDAINLVSQSWGRVNLRPGDVIALSVLEHHSNLVPWQLAAKATGAELMYADVTDEGTIDLDSLDRVLATGRVKMVALTGMSNVLGTITPVAEIVRRAHDVGSLVLVDAAQSAPHGPTDVAALGADFLAFSGHKLFGPTGVGVLYGRADLLDAMPPVQGGGSMVLKVGLHESSWTEVPGKFEAGTPPIAEAIGLGAAVSYLEKLDWTAIHAHEAALTEHAHQVLGAVPGVTIHGPGPDQKGPILGFSVDLVHPHDLAQLVDREGVAIRAGHHCAMPLHSRFGLTATARASMAFYNTIDEVERRAAAIPRARAVFGGR